MRVQVSREGGHMSDMDLWIRRKLDGIHALTPDALVRLMQRAFRRTIQQAMEDLAIDRAYELGSEYR
jgi:hypothetical protein